MHISKYSVCPKKDHTKIPITDQVDSTQGIRDAWIGMRIINTWLLSDAKAFKISTG